MYPKDRTKNGGRLSLHVKENLPCKIIYTSKFNLNSKIIINWVIIIILGRYEPPLENDLWFINELDLALNLISPMYNFNISTVNRNLEFYE